MQLQPLQQRLDQLEAAERDAAKATKAAEHKLAEMKSRLGVAKQRTEPDDEDQRWDLWAGPDWRRQETWTQNRRDEKLREGANATAPRSGKFGAIQHWRRGLAGCVRDWACGSIVIAVSIIVSLITYLGLLEKVRAALPQTAADRQAETEHCIVDLMEQGFNETKHCRTEAQRQQFHIGMGYIAPLRDSKMIARIGERFNLHWGTRSKRAGEEKGRPYAFDQAIDRREVFNQDVKLQDKPLKPGDQVLAHGDL